MIPAYAHTNFRIRSVSIHHNKYIRGFSFFDEVGTRIWKIGDTDWSELEVTTLVLAENEVIVGVVAKLRYQSWYTDF